MTTMNSDKVTTRCLEAGCGVLLEAMRVRLQSGEEVLRPIPNFEDVVETLRRSMGLGYLWIVKPLDPADHPFTAPEDQRVGIIVCGSDGAVRGFLRKAGGELGLAWAIVRRSGSTNIELIPTKKGGPQPLDVGVASAVPLIRAFGFALKMTPPQEDGVGCGEEVPDLGELVVREPIGFFSGLLLEAKRKERHARSAKETM